MRNYEAMFIIKPDMSENEKKDLFAKVREIIEKNNCKILSADIWSEKRKLYFRLKKFREGLYYLVVFDAEPQIIPIIRNDFKLNEDILRVLITVTK